MTIVKITVGVFVLSLGIGQICSAADYLLGLDAYEKGNFNLALVEFSELAEAGFHEAQYNLGVMYDNGHGVNEDDETAFKWFLAAAEGGISQAQFNLGEMYRSGEGTEQNLSQALKWLMRSADSGDVDSYFSLGLTFEAGASESDYANALRWYVKGAEAGHAPSQSSLAALYANGLGVQVSLVKAYMWASLASLAGIEGANSLKSFVSSKMTAGQLELAEKQLESCANKAYLNC